MPANRNKIVQFIQDYLKVKDFADYCVNGLQVEGADQVEKIITGVSFSQKLVEAAIEKKAQMIMVHHGIFSRDITSPLELKGVFRNRLKLLLSNDINLAGFHLPLDAHPEIGNNANICKLLSIKNTDPFYVGFVGDLEQPSVLDDFIKFVDTKLNTKSFVLKNNDQLVKRIGVVSGGGAEEFSLAAELGANTYLTGEIKESTVRAAEEAGVNIIAAGHYNTEKLGIINLGNLIAQEFDVKAEFVDIPCEI